MSGDNDKKPFKAIVRVVKSIAKSGSEWMYGFGSVEALREPLIYAKDKSEVKEIMASKYPQFFQNGKVYERETKDTAQFFYVVIYPLYNHEEMQIKEGPWKCSYCGQEYENKYLFRPVINVRLFGDKVIFCRSDDDYCIKNYTKENIVSEYSGDDLSFITSDSPTYIYKVTEKSTGKCYVGKTKNAPFFRWWNHLKHSDSPFGIYLRSTTLDCWVFEVLKILPSSINDSKVFEIETSYMNEFDSIKNGFNSVVSKKNTSQ